MHDICRVKGAKAHDSLLCELIES